MFKTAKVALAFGICHLFASCAAINSPVGGLLVTAVQAPKSAAAGESGSRLGESCAHSILGLVAFGDASIETARRNGGVVQISSVDQSFLQILFLYGRSCTMVRGR